MSTQIQLHVRTDEMTDEMLMGEGIIGGPMAQLTTDGDFDAFMEATSNADSVIVGNSMDDGTSDIADLYDGPTEVTETKVNQTSATIASSDDVDPSILDWLENHERGGSVRSPLVGRWSSTSSPTLRLRSSLRLYCSLRSRLTVPITTRISDSVRK